MFANVMIKMATKSHILFRLSVIFLVLLNASQYVHGWDSQEGDSNFHYPAASRVSASRRRYLGPSLTGHPVDLRLFDRPCQCIKLNQCHVFIDILSRTSVSSISSMLAHKFRQASCGFRNTEPIVCCPIMFDSKRLGSKREYLPAAAGTSSTTTEEAWVWDIQQGDLSLTTPSPKGFGGPWPMPPHWDAAHPYHYEPRYNTPITHNHIHSHHPPGPPFGKKNRYFYAHFEDPRTRKNCPPSFSDEFDLPNSIDPEPVKMGNDILLPPSPMFVSSGGTPTRTTNTDTDTITTSSSTSTTTSTAASPDVEIQPVTAEPEAVTTTTAASESVPSELDLIRLSKLQLINSELCGLSIKTRIIGGDDAGPGQFPWLARIAYRNRTSGRVTYRCSGSVISDRYVLTAAHCVQNLVDDLEVIMVRLGELDTRSDRDCNSDSSRCTEAQDFEIESIVAHSMYDTPKYANDIALIRLRRTTNSTFISPLCLPLDKYAAVAGNLDNQSGIIAGWGSMTAGSNAASPLLQWVRLPIVANAGCATSYARFSANSRTPIVVSESQLCVQGRENMDACQGDSGGPLMTEAASERYTLIGLVSFGPRTCGVSNFPGVYTRISAFSSWIMDNMTL